MKNKKMKTVVWILLINMMLSTAMPMAKAVETDETGTSESTVISSEEESKIETSGNLVNTYNQETTETTTAIEAPETTKSKETPEEVMQSSSEEIIENEEVELYFEDEFNQYPFNRSELPVQRSGRSKRSASPLFAPRANKLPIISVTDKKTPSKDFIDISSHNGALTSDEFVTIKSYGITGVVVKLTEGITYQNPYAKDQVKNALAAGLKVSAYHYSWFTTTKTAQAEADYFAKYAQEIGLPKGTVMVNDIEEPKITGKADHTATSLDFQRRLNSLGYNNVTHYFSASWITDGRINPNSLGYQNIWIAAYPYTVTTEQKYSQYGGWQWSPELRIPGVKSVFDISSDYSGKFTTAKPKPIPPKPVNPFASQGRPTPKAGLWYRSHVSDLGWLGFVGSEVLSGTTGQNRRLEAIDVTWNKQKGSIRSSFQDINGRWVESGNGITGSVGKALGVQKVCFASNAALLQTGRKLQYRVHSQDVGWSSWKEEGAPAGTNGKRIEAIEMRMVINGVVERG